MTIEYLKKASPPQEEIGRATAETVQCLLADIRKNGREAVERHARTGDIRLKKYFPQQSFELGTLAGHRH